MICAFCQCTDHQACEGGCSWALPEVCTACLMWKNRFGATFRVVAVAEGQAMIHNPRMGYGLAGVDDMQHGQYGWRRALQ